jgi:2',3'-cyclic-nucleotide 2'-phosphodiesterase (5'-nucleotidase family)
MLNRSRFLRPFLIAGLLVGLTACQTALPVAEADRTSFRPSFTVISDTLTDDPAMEAMVAPYRQSLQDAVSEVIATAAFNLEKDKPEGVLGNLAADAMLALAREHSAGPVHMALTNNGGLRVPINEGPVTVGNVFELMPFENMMVVLTISGEQVDSLAQQLAHLGGEAIAGFSFAVEMPERRAVDVRVGGEPLDRGATYRLVTSDFVADGGDNIIIYPQPPERELLPVLLRDAFIEYFRREGTLAPRLEGRITINE